MAQLNDRGGVEGHPADYEFSQKENVIIDDVGRWSKILGIVMIVSGGLSAISCNVIGAGIDITVGVLLIQAAGAFQFVVSRQDYDVPAMMRALDKLGTTFFVRSLVVLIAVGLLLLIGGAVAVFFSMPRPY